MSGSVHRRVSEHVAAGAESTAFLGSILAGWLLGYLGDRALGTDPLLVVLGIIAGFVIGFWRMWMIANREDAS